MTLLLSVFVASSDDHFSFDYTTCAMPPQAGTSYTDPRKEMNKLRGVFEQQKPCKGS
jgi:hypothetical protein